MPNLQGFVPDNCLEKCFRFLGKSYDMINEWKKVVDAIMIFDAYDWGFAFVYVLALSAKRHLHWGPGGSVSWVVGLPNNSYKPITNTVWVRARLCRLHKRCTRRAAASDKAYQLPMVGGSLRVLRPLPSLKLVAMILLKVGLNTKNKSIAFAMETLRSYRSRNFASEYVLVSWKSKTISRASWWAFTKSQESDWIRRSYVP